MKDKKSKVIVESPAKAKTIQKILGDNYLVTACMGHIRDLPEKKMGVDIKDNFRPTYVIPPQKRKIVSKLKKEISPDDDVYLASDFDREGEAIAWHLAQVLGIPLDKAKRVVFNEITYDAIKKAFSNPCSITMDLVYAQQARRILDRLVGYKLSPLLWRKIAKGLSAGRVQSVALKLVVERDKEISNFKPEEYWKISGVFQKLNSEKCFLAHLVKFQDNKVDIKSEEEALRVKKVLEEDSYIVKLIEEKEEKKQPSPPFITSTLQQVASQKFGYSASRTMRIAQELYEGIELGSYGHTGLITYMRTDSTRIAESAIDAVRKYISKKFPGYLNESVRRYESKSSAQGAHEAIRPTNIELEPERIKQYLSTEQYKLYDLIYRRFLATQVKPAVYKHRKIVIAGSNSLFEITSQVPLFDGCQKFFGKLTYENEDIPELEENEQVKLREIKLDKAYTEPPPHYTEASLIKTLEKNDIGRPSTFATIIDTILKRGYVKKIQKKLISTELGRLVVEKLEKYFSSIMDVNFTAEMEKQLDLIENGRVDWIDVTKKFYASFSKDLELALAEMESEKKRCVAETCPQCGAPLVIRWSKNGKFYGCSNFPRCKFTKPINNEEVKDLYCEKCGAKLVVKNGRRGRFYACPNYPKCDYTKSVSSEDSVEKTE